LTRGARQPPEKLLALPSPVPVAEELAADVQVAALRQELRAKDDELSVSHDSLLAKDDSLRAKDDELSAKGRDARKDDELRVA